MKRQNSQTLIPSILFGIIVIIYLFISQSATAQMQFEWVKNYPNFQGHSAEIIYEGYDSNTDAIKLIFITDFRIRYFSKLILSGKFI